MADPHLLFLEGEGRVRVTKETKIGDLRSKRSRMAVRFQIYDLRFAISVDHLFFQW
jgi:hypothetical protein